ncbi:MAG: tRNA threonylcarbamoyladenosine dehydratase [Clostridiales bacterium]|jgi:tRNA A37 threonylcarbamoyladenosine dehydratase|nr:tRNA threonylcarbamoyladenosine dehydratase [Clostridiales bacterium]
MLLGSAAMEKLRLADVAVFGIGGVGSYAAEALARGGIGGLTLVDDDKVCLTNINRQLCATLKTVGRDKVEVMREKILEINPRARVEVHNIFYGAQNAEAIELSGYSYIIDAVDTVSAKLCLIERAEAAGVPIISCMGAGNKIEPTLLEVTDIFSTSVCPLAKVMRKELRARGIERLKVVYSKEAPIHPDGGCESCKNNCVCPPGVTRKCTDRRQIPGSVSFVPPAAGLIMAGEVIKDLIGWYA